MCERRPCWPTPNDVERLIETGLADRLMLDWWFDKTHDRTVYILTPAIAGRDGGQAPAIPSGRCTFLDGQGLCQLHDKGLKPTEGQLALCKGRTRPDLHEHIGETWNNDAAQSLIDQWEKSAQRGRLHK